MSSDSGVWTGGEGAPGGDLSPTSRRRPRNLEMVMKGSHSFHLRELQDDDLDIMGKIIIYPGAGQALSSDSVCGLEVRARQEATCL